MGKNVRRWYGVSANGEVLFRGTETEVSDFRNACHRFFRELHQDKYKHHFPLSDGQRRHGTCRELAAFRALTSQIFRIEKRGRQVWLIHRTGQDKCVHP